MSQKPDIDAFYHAYALSIFGWKCLICNIEAKDQVGIEMAWLGDEQVVYTDSIDGSKWVCCNVCKEAYHLAVLLPKLRSKLKQKAGHLSALLIRANKWVSARSGTRSTKWVTIVKRVTKRVIFFSMEMAKEKYSTKGRHRKKGSKKKVQTDQQKRDAVSHKGQKNQAWKEEKMELLKQNEDLPPNKKLSYRAIAKKVGIPAITIIERLSGRRKGKGHIAGGASKARVLSEGKFKQVTNQVKITVTITILTELLPKVPSGSASGSASGSFLL